jgi:flagellar basal-body rod modification protein FlgD
MSVYDVAGLGSTTAATTVKKSGYASLDQSDFLRLMTEQMKAQDPMSPVDNKEMLAQMAQFSQLAGVNDINKNLTALGQKLDAIVAAQKVSAPAPAAAAAVTTPN